MSGTPFSTPNGTSIGSGGNSHEEVTC